MPNFLKYGLLAGALAIVYSLVVHFTGSDLRFNTKIPFILILVLPILFMVMAVKADRNLQEGLISFGEALKTSFLTYLVFIVIFSLASQLLVGLYSDADWDKYLEIQKGMMEATFNAIGADQVMIDEQLDNLTIESMKDQVVGVGPAMIMIVTYSIVGLILSLIVSAIMKRNPTP